MCDVEADERDAAAAAAATAAALFGAELRVDIDDEDI